MVREGCGGMVWYGIYVHLSGCTCDFIFLVCFVSYRVGGYFCGVEIGEM